MDPTTLKRGLCLFRLARTHTVDAGKGTEEVLGKVCRTSHVQTDRFRVRDTRNIKPREETLMVQVQRRTRGDLLV